MDGTVSRRISGRGSSVRRDLIRTACISQVAPRAASLSPAPYGQHQGSTSSELAGPALSVARRSLIRRCPTRRPHHLLHSHRRDAATLLSFSGMFGVDGSPIDPAHRGSAAGGRRWLPRYPGKPAWALCPRHRCAGAKRLRGLCDGSVVCSPAYCWCRCGLKSRCPAAQCRCRCCAITQLVLLTFLSRIGCWTAHHRSRRAGSCAGRRSSVTGLAVSSRDRLAPRHLTTLPMPSSRSEGNSQWALFCGKPPGANLERCLVRIIGGVFTVTQADDSRPAAAGVIGFRHAVASGRSDPRKMQRRIPTPSSTRCGGYRGTGRDLEVAGLHAQQWLHHPRRSRVIACAVLVLGNLISVHSNWLGHLLEPVTQQLVRRRALLQQRQPRRSRIMNPAACGFPQADRGNLVGISPADQYRHRLRLSFPHPSPKAKAAPALRPPLLDSGGPLPLLTGALAAPAAQFDHS